MTHKHNLLALLLPSFFLFTVTSPAQQPSAWEKEGAKAVGTVVATQTLDTINLIKDKYDIMPSEKRAQIDLYKTQRLLADEQITGCKKQDTLNDQQAELNDKQSTLTDKQIELTDGQIADNKLERHLKIITLSKETLALLDSQDPAVKETKERLKLAMKEFNKDLPEVPAEEPKKTEPEKKEEAPKQDSFFTSLATYCVLGATAAGTAADAIAEYSFKNITDLDCFKDTFISNHSLGINRALVAVTATIIAYKSYSFYKAYQAERNFREEDIFNDDLD